MVTILLVDDSPVDRTLAARLMSGESEVEVQQAGNGVEALEMISRQVPDVIVTDIHMPEMNGLELLSAVQQQCPQVSVVLMTARGTEELAVEGLSLGAASYVPKRRLATDLLDTVERVWYASAEEEQFEQVQLRIASTELQLAVEPDVELLLSIARYLQRLLAIAWDCSPSVRMQTGTAVEEAFTNACYYGALEMDSRLRSSDRAEFYREAEERRQCEPYCSRKIEIAARFTPEEFECTISSAGEGFDPASLPEVTSGKQLDQSEGRGLHLMRTFMDEVRFSSDGRQVTLKKYRPAV